MRLGIVATLLAGASTLGLALALGACAPEDNPSVQGTGGEGGSSGAAGQAGNLPEAGTDSAAGSAGSAGAAGSETDAGVEAEAGPPPEHVEALDGVQVTTLAGSDVIGSTDGVGAAAQFNNPVNVALDPSGNLIVCDFDNALLRQVTPDGTVTTVLEQSTFVRPFGIVFTASGELYVQTDGDIQGNPYNQGDSVLWKVNLESHSATAVAQHLGRPRGLALLSDGRMVLSDPQNHYVRLMDLSSGQTAVLAGAQGQPGFVDGVGAEARFNRPYGTVIVNDGDILVADMANNRIRKIKSTGEVSTFAGDGQAGMVDGPALQASFNQPIDLAVDSLGNVYVSDSGNHRFRRIDPQGNVKTVAGSGVAGFRDGSGLEAQFYGQEGFTAAADGKTLFVADGTIGDPLPYNRVRKITLP